MQDGARIEREARHSLIDWAGSTLAARETGLTPRPPATGQFDMLAMASA